MKSVAVLGLLLFSLLFCYLTYQESSVWPRGSWIRTINTPEYVHERYQRSYFSLQDAQRLRRLHNEQAVTLLAIISCLVAIAYLKRETRS